jgi:hypothetical protein
LESERKNPSIKIKNISLTVTEHLEPGRIIKYGLSRRKIADKADWMHGESESRVLEKIFRLE